MAVPRTEIALFAYAGVAPETSDCLLRDLPRLSSVTYRRISGDALISRSRSRVASEFLDGDADVLVMLDHDLAWAPGDLQRLIERCAQTRSVVAGVYSKRAFGGGVAVRLAASGAWRLGTNRRVRAQHVSTGFCAIHRVLLERLARDLPETREGFRPFFLPMLGEPSGSDPRPEYLSEDWSMCERARRAGFSIWADLEPQLVHHGAHGYRPLDARLTLPDEQPIAVYRTIEPEDATLAALPAVAQRRLEELAREADLIGDAARSAWWRRDDVGECALLALAGRVCTGEAEWLDRELAALHPRRALEWGGVGCMAVALAARGVQMDVHEPSPALRAFIGERARRHAAPLSWVDAPRGPYDLIVAWDPPEQLDCAGVLANSFARDGCLLSAALDDDRPPHPLAQPDAKWHHALRTAGLEPAGARAWVRAT